MNGTFRQSMSWLHTWAGLVLAWVLYFMFVTGSVGYFDNEIDRWMQPEISVDNSISQAQMLGVAEQRLQKVAPDAQSWYVDFPVGRATSFDIWWQDPAGEKTEDGEQKEGKWHDEKLNPATGEPIVARKTGGGQLLYRMHYVLHYMPRVLAYWITSLCAMFMLVGLITGIVVHKKIFKDFFTFRPNKNQRSWLDMHNVLSVLPLPFHLMITYSGLLFLMFTTMPATMIASYGLGEENKERFFDAVFEQGEHKDAAGIAENNISLTAVLNDANARWGENQIAYISIENRGDINAHIELSQYGYDGLSDGESLTYNAVNGELQHAKEEASGSSAVVKFREVMFNLHEGQFAGTVLRWLYFISGLMGAGMVATGMILWATKRRQKAQKKGTASKGLVLVEYLNVGTVVGFPIAIAVYFWANRLIPVGFEGRADWEVHSLFIAWAVMLLSPALFTRKYSLTQVWVGQLLLAAALYALLPILNALTTDKGLVTALQQGDWMMAGFDLSMLGIALCFAFTAYKLQSKTEKKRRIIKQEVLKPESLMSEAMIKTEERNKKMDKNLELTL